MLALHRLECLHPSAAGHHTAVAVVLEVHKRRRIRIPRRQELNDQAGSSRGEHSIRPYDLRARAGLAVLVRLLSQALLRHESAAPETWPAWSREDDLAADEGPSPPRKAMYVHAEVDIGNQIPTSETLKLVSFTKRVQGADDNVRRPQRFGGLLPPLVDSDDPRPRVQAPDDPRPDTDFRGFDVDVVESTSRKPIQVPHEPPENGESSGSTVDIGQCASDKAIRVCLINVVWIYEDVAPDAHVCSLLHHVRTSAP